MVHAPLDADRRPGVEVAYGVGKAVGNAVARNRVRRRLRVLMRECLSDGRLPEGRYLVTVAPAGADTTFHDLRRHLHRALAELPQGDRP